MPASDYIDEALVEALFTGIALPLADPIYVALYSAGPTKAGGGTELTQTGYARLAVAANDSSWQLLGPPWAARNLETLVFGPATGWPTVVAFGLLDAAVAGNLLFFDDLTSPTDVPDGQSAVFTGAALSVSGQP